MISVYDKMAFVLFVSIRFGRDEYKGKLER